MASLRSLLAIGAAAVVAAAGNSTEHYSLTEYKQLFGYDPNSVGMPEAIPCDICKWALGKAYSIGCSAAGTWISGACLDFAPVCEAALKILCGVCSSSCDVPTAIQDACQAVNLCPAPAPPPTTGGGGSTSTGGTSTGGGGSTTTGGGGGSTSAALRNARVNSNGRRHTKL